MQNKHELTYGLFCLKLLVAIGCVSGCQSSTEYVTLLIPSDYRGLFVVILATKDGQPSRKTNAGYVYQIPESGVLRISDMGPYNGPIIERYRIGIGTESRCLDYDERPKSNEVALWRLTSGKKQDWFFVGTTEEREELSKNNRLPEHLDAFMSKRGIKGANG